jgi:hypothetical protein
MRRRQRGSFHGGWLMPLFCGLARRRGFEIHLHPIGLERENASDARSKLLHSGNCQFKFERRNASIIRWGGRERNRFGNLLPDSEIAPRRDGSR